MNVNEKPQYDETTGEIFAWIICGMVCGVFILAEKDGCAIFSIIVPLFYKLLNVISHFRRGK